MDFANRTIVKDGDEGVSLEFIYQPETGQPEYVALIEMPETAATELEGLLRMRREAKTQASYERRKAQYGERSW